MTNMNLYKFIGAILVLGAITYVGVTFPQTSVFVGSPVGTTFNTAKIAAINMTISTASATSSSILNSDASARYITDGFVACTGIGTSLTAVTGAGLATLQFQMATTSTSAPANLGTNYSERVTLATSSATFYVASTTEGAIAGFSRYWDAGTYLTIQPNATNTAACTVGVHYLAS